MNKNEVAVKERNVTDSVLARVVEMQGNKQLIFPPNYSPENALKSAWLILQDAKTNDKQPVLQACTQNSIANSLLDMVVQGLNPMKNQCYFIPYGKSLTLQRSYLGTMAIAKRLPNVTDINFQVIYEGDEVAINIEAGRKVIESHIQKFENINPEKVVGAYCVISFYNDSKDDVVRYTEIMTIAQIKSAWNQGQMKGNSGAHKNFTDQMALKTVINRACKFFVNSSDDSSLLSESFARTSRNESPEIQYELLDAEVCENQAVEMIDIAVETGEVMDEPTEQIKVSDGPDF